MISTCPNCDRSLATNPEAQFCMFCGHKLFADVSAPIDTLSSETPISLESVSDPHATHTYRGQLPSQTGVTDYTLTPAPERVGGYRLVKRLGVGGMGQVYEAESEDGSERVAVKLLSQKLATNPTSVERFRQEGRLASQISHPRCVFVYGVDAEEGRPFIVMELMPGSTLKDLVDQRGPLPWDEAITRILDVIDGLIEAHRVGMLHRDVKPSNCFLTADDRVKIGDFGLSKSLDNQTDRKQLTSSGTFLGTVLFASPEQIRGEEVSYDSDVYSVAATLYYLLTKKAPYQHESMTAALAKAISEAPPSIRKLRPDVPAILERIVFRGMERDRKRRFTSLTEFRDALQELLPERQHAAPLRSLIAAYLIDSVVAVLLLQLPIELFESAVGWSEQVHLGVRSGTDPLWLGASIAYFAICEGFFGATLGKFLLRLRVQRLDRPGPPGWTRATIRTAVYHGLWWCVMPLPVLVTQIPYVGIPLAILIVVAAILTLFLQIWPWPVRSLAARYRVDLSIPHRGLHDWLSRCRVVQRARPVQRLRLISDAPNPLDHLRPLGENVPTTIGGFMLQGKLTDLPNDGSVWVGEDGALNRRVLLWLRPARELPNGLPEYPVRPGRLRVVSTGEQVLSDGAYAWAAFVAPDGAPLVQTIRADEPLGWDDTRIILEQLVDELYAAECDGSTPQRLGLDQLWAEPDGRVHLLEFPVGPTLNAVSHPIELVRQAAILSLEGMARSEGGRVAAPLPSHAMKILDPLTAHRDQPPTLAEVQDQLRQSHASPPRVTLAMRAAHIGLIAALSGIGLFMMLMTVCTFGIQSVLMYENESRITSELRADLDTPAELNDILEFDPSLGSLLTPEQIPVQKAKLQQLEEALQVSITSDFDRLSRLERTAVETIRSISSTRRANRSDRSTAPPPNFIYRVRLVRETDLNSLHDPARHRTRLFRSSLRVIGFVLIGFIVFATLFRGGLSFVLSGVTLVTTDGRPASRWRCGWREFLMWVPLVVALVVSVVVQTHYPTAITFRIASIVIVGVTVIIYLVVGLRYPERGPHDYVAGTHMVPA